MRMSAQTITVEFVGPFSWLEGQAIPSIFRTDAGKRPGVYLWTVPLDEGELVYYVGETGRAFSGQVRELPSAYTFLLLAMDFGIGPAQEVVIVGASPSQDTARMLDALNSCFLPNHVLLFRPSKGTSSAIDRVAPIVKGRETIDGKATAYVCVSNACQAPVTDPAEMMQTLQ